MRRAVAVLLLVLGLAVPARAEVVSSGANGFSLTVTAEIASTPDAVFKALTTQIGSWWSPDHTYSGSAANMSLDLRAGGCFCETWPNGGVHHMTVTHVMAPRTLVMNGGLGPLGTMGVAGAMEWSLTLRNGRTSLQMTYNVGGYAPGGLEALAPLVDAVLASQVKRLAMFVETGRPQ